MSFQSRQIKRFLPYFFKFWFLWNGVVHECVFCKKFFTLREYFLFMIMFLRLLSSCSSPCCHWSAYFFLREYPKGLKVSTVWLLILVLFNLGISDSYHLIFSPYMQIILFQKLNFLALQQVIGKQVFIFVASKTDWDSFWLKWGIIVL